MKNKYLMNPKPIAVKEHKIIAFYAFAPRSLRFLRYALCAMLRALCAFAPRSLRVLLSALCSLLSALCAFPPRSVRFLRSALCALLFLVCILVVPSIAIADVLSKFHPIIVLREEYTDNVNLSPTDRQADWISTLGLGLRYSTLPASSEVPGQILQAPAAAEPAGIDLQYLAGLGFYANNSQANFVSHAGRLNTWYSLDRNLTFRLREYFIRSQDPREIDYSQMAVSGQYLLGARRGLSPYIRNVLEPSLDYRFGKENLFSLYYRNNIYQSQDPAYQNTQENYINPRLTYWFNIRNGITLEYGYTKGDFERSPDLTGHLARGRYIYRFNPRTSINGDYLFLKRDFETPGIPYEIQNPSFGIDHAFTSTLRGFAQVGYYWRNPKGASSSGGPSANIGLTQNKERTIYTLSLQTGYRESYFTAQSLGFTKYYGSFASITHRLGERFTLGATGSLERIEITDPDRKDWLWRVSGNASYQILRWLNASLNYYHQENLSNDSNIEYRENRVIINLNATL